MKKFFSSLLLCLIILQAGCSQGFSQQSIERLSKVQAPAVSPKKTLPTTSEGPSVTMVADFEKGLENLLGGQTGDWNLNPSDVNNSYTDLAIVPFPGKDGKESKVLRLTYSVDSDIPAQNGFWTKLMGFDASQYDHFEMDVKGDAAKGFTEKFKMEIKKCLDKDCLETVQGSAIVPVTPEWQTVNIPLNQMTGLIDFQNPEAWKNPRISYNNLNELIFIFNDKFVTKRTGRIFFDNIRFTRTGQPGPSAVDHPEYGLKKTTIPHGTPEFAKFLAGRLRGFPKTISVKKQFPEEDKAFLKEVARDTWRFFDEITDTEHGLPLDNIKLGDTVPLGEGTWIGDYTNITNVGVYLMAVVSAYDLGFITKEDAVARMQKTLTTMEKLECHKSGFPYNYYDTTLLVPTSYFVSFVDSGWLYLGYYVAKNAFPEELSEQVGRLLARANFKFFYDPVANQMYHGYYENLGVYTDYRYGVFYAEPRAATYMAIARGDVPEKLWFEGVVRTFPLNYKWQSQTPKNRTERTVLGYKYAGGYYEWKDLQYVPSWGGSSFEALMPTVVLEEKKLAPEGLGKNDAVHAQGQMRYALEELGMPVWGMSPSADPSGSYTEYGAKPFGIKGYKAGVVTPHASALALEFMPAEAVQNLRKLIELYDIYGEYGFYDAVSVPEGKVARKYYSLDQGMILIAINNYLHDGAIRKRFHADPEMKKGDNLLTAEKFFETASQDTSAGAKP
jgi:hypothetical protein